MQHLWLAAIVADGLDFDGHICLEAHGKAGAIGEIHLEVWTIVAVLEDGANANDLPGEFFAINHEFLPAWQNCVRAWLSILEHITLIVCRLIVVKDKPLLSA